MTWLLAGIFAGLAVAFTGAGAAMICLPLFMGLGGLKLSEATILTLVAVAVTSGLNAVFSRRHARYGTALLMVGIAAVGTGMGVAIRVFWGAKGQLYTIAISLVIFLSALAVARVFARRRARMGSVVSVTGRRLTTAIGGLPLGLFTSTSGLAGAGMVATWLGEIACLPEGEALATTHVVVFLTSLGAVIGLGSAASLQQAGLVPMLALALGAAPASVLGRRILDRLRPSTQTWVRRLGTAGMGFASLLAWMV